MNPCTSNYPILDAHLTLGCIGFHKKPPFGGVTEIVKGFAKDKAMREKKPKEKIEEAVSEALKQFSDRCNEVGSEITKSFEKKKILPLYYSMKSFMVFCFFIDSQLKKYLACCPDDQAFREEYEKFYEQIALLRYGSSEESLKQVQAFLHLVKNKLLEIGQWDDQEDAHDWQVWEKIISYKGISQVDLAYFLHANEYIKHHVCTRTLKISVRHLCDAYSLLAKCFLERSQAFLHKHKKIFTDFHNSPQYPGLIYSPQIVESLDKLSELVKQSPLLIKNQVEEIITGKALLKSLKKEVVRLQGINEDQKQKFILPNNYNLILHFEERLDNLKLLHNRYARPDTTAYALKNIMHFTADREVTPNESFNKDWTLAELEKALEFQRQVFRAHVELDGFLLNPVFEMVKIVKALTEWAEAQKALGKFSMCLNLLKDPSQSIPFIEESWMQQASVKKEKTPKKSSFTPKKQEILSKEIEVEATPVLPKSLPNTLTLFENTLLLSHKLGQVAGSIEEKGYAKIVARQAHMYLTDIAVYFKRLDASYTPGNACELATSLESASYFFMEQWIRYHRLIQEEHYDPNVRFDEHNLSRSLRLLKKKQNVDERAVKQLYLGYLWVHSTYEQYNQWLMLRDQWGILMPQSLLLLMKAEKSHSEKELSVQKSKLKQSIEATISFAQSLPFADGKTQDVDEKYFEQDTTTFIVKAKLNSELFQDLYKTVEKFQKQSPSLKLKQIYRDLKILEQKFKRFDEKKISALEFSTLIRETVFWQSCILERFLQLIIEMQTKEGCEIHDISELIKRISLHAPFEENETSFLKENFFNLHNTSRYPFEFEPQTNLHRLILHAEFLRERPELNEGYSFNKEKKVKDNKISTSLNFLPVDSEELGAQQIVEKLCFTFERLISFSRERLFPEIMRGLTL